MTIPLIFWLVLVSNACGLANAGGSGCGTSMLVMPVPFGSGTDCAIASKQFGEESYCLQQRLSDFEIMRNDNGSFGWRHYPQVPQ